MKILHLPLKKKWFDMIASGEKKEEYRALKDHWFDRLTTYHYPIIPKRFDAICFKNGYRKDAPTITVKWLGCEIGTPRPEWSDNWQGEVFIIKLGEIIR